MKPQPIQSDQEDLPKDPTFFTRSQAAIALTFWTMLGTILRLLHLDSKPPWTDEFATLLYSRGDDYSSIPINEVVTAEALLAPLKGYPVHGVGEVANLLIRQNNHPPLYFMGVNLWQRFFPLDESGYISIYSVRSLSVIFGVLGIIGIYWVAKQAFRSEITAQLSAALLAMSPFGIYLAQEARHYTLIICWAIASFSFCFYVIQQLTEKRRLSYRFVLGWIGFNCVGLLIHYFFLLTLLGQAIALLWLIRKSDLQVTKSQWLRLGLIGIGTSILGLIWLTQVLPDSYGSTMTDWIHLDYRDPIDWVSPLFRLAIALMTMVILLPIQTSFVPTILVAGILMIVVSIRLIKLWWQGINLQAKYPSIQPSIFFLSRFVVVVGGLFVLTIYGFGIDISRGARYSFVYFPAVILLLAAGLNPFWQKENVNFFGIQKLFKIFPKSGSQAIALILTISLCSSLTVVNDLGYKKPYAPDKLLANIQQNPQPAIILTPYKSTVQIGEMMAIAWEKYRQHNAQSLSFAFIPVREKTELYEQDIETLFATMSSENIQLWAINFFETLTIKGCEFSYRNSERGYYSEIHQCVNH